MKEPEIEAAELEAIADQKVRIAEAQERAAAALERQLTARKGIEAITLRKMPQPAAEIRRKRA